MDKLTDGQRMIEAAERLNEADCETLWATIQDLATRVENPLPKHVLDMAQVRHWTVQHTALALAYVLMMQGK
jgi:hypothetical protein